MSDFGADVIKIEPPGVGDPWRARSDQRRTERLLLAVDVAQQTQPGAGSEARGGPRRAASAGGGRRCVRHQLSAAGARPVEAGAGGSAAAEPAADLCVVHRVWRGGRRSGEDRLRLHGVLGAHRPDGCGARRRGHAAGAVRAGHGRSSQRHRPVRRHRHRAVPAREDRTRRGGPLVAAAERPVGEWLLRADAAVRRTRAASSAARAGAERAGQPLSLSRRPLVHHGAVERAASVAPVADRDRPRGPGRRSALRHQRSAQAERTCAGG